MKDEINDNRIIKHLPLNEQIAVESLEELGVAYVLAPYHRKGNIMTMEKGMHDSRLSLDIVLLYTKTLAPLYRIHSHQETGQLYSFWKLPNSESIGTKGYYRTTLQKLRGLAESTSPAKELRPALVWAFGEMEKYCSLFSESDGEPAYCLLHGDLHNGNILRFGEEYRLIDAEFLQFGPREAELAFLLCWDYFVHPTFCSYAPTLLSKEILTLHKCEILSQTEIRKIVMFFIPMILAAAILFLEQGRYKYSEEMIRGIQGFFSVYQDWRSNNA